jgi:4-amino-4-deoxy-L-arabinose transferase-like glycosyltransferase
VPSCSAPPSKASLAGLIVVSLIVNLVGLWWGLPNQPEAWAPDELTPLEVLEGARQRFSGGWFALYPPLHYYVLAVVQLPVVAAIWLGWTSLSDPTTYTVLFVLVRLVSTAMATATVVLVYACGCELYDRTSALGAALMTALILPLVYYAKVANVDAPYVFWYVLALWFYLRALRTSRLRDYLGLAVAAVSAVTTKDQAFALFLPMPLALAVAEFRRRQASGSKKSWLAAAAHRHLLIAGAVAVGLLVAIENPVFNWPGVLERLRWLSQATVGFEEVPDTFAGYLHLLGLAVGHVRFSLGWPFFLLAAVGTVRLLCQSPSSNRQLAVLAPVLSYLLLLLLPIRFVFDRYVLPVAVTATLFGGPLLKHLVSARRLQPAGLLLGVGSVVYTFAYAVSVDWLLVSDARYDAERWLAASVPRGSRIAAIGVRPYLPRLNQFDAAYIPEPTIEEVMAVNAPYLIVTSAWGADRFRGAPEVLEFFSRLRRGTLDYLPVSTHRGRPLWNLVSFRGIRTNLDKINPEIVIYRRQPSPSTPASALPSEPTHDRRPAGLSSPGRRGQRARAPENPASRAARWPRPPSRGCG